MILDFHTHVYPEKIADKGVAYTLDFYEFPHHHQGFGTIGHLNKSCAEAGVTDKVLLAVSTRADQVESINNFTSSLLDHHTFGFGCMHPDYPQPELELERFASLGLIGVKFHSDMQQCDIDDPRLYPVYRWAAEHHMPVCLHMGDPRYDYSHPRRLARVLDDFPNLVVIAAHFGGYRRWEEAKQYLCGRQVYFDTSSSLPYSDIETLKEVFALHGTDKFLFGTDYPLTSQADELKRLDALNLSADAKEAVLWQNGKALLARYGVEL